MFFLLRLHPCAQFGRPVQPDTGAGHRPGGPCGAAAAVDLGAAFLPPAEVLPEIRDRVAGRQQDGAHASASASASDATKNDGVVWGPWGPLAVRRTWSAPFLGGQRWFVRVMIKVCSCIVLP